MFWSIMKLVGNRSFTLTTANGKQSRLQRLQIGVPSGIRPGTPSNNLICEVKLRCILTLLND